MNALTTMWKRPRVRMYNGIDRNCTIGLTNALTSPNITATTKMMPTLCGVVLPPTKRIPMGEPGDNPQCKSGQCGAQQKGAHVGDPATERPECA